MTWVVGRQVGAAVSVVLLIAGCAGETATASPTALPPAMPLPALTSTPSTFRPLPAETVVPSPARWLEVADQASVRGTVFADVAWTGTRFVAVGVNGSDRAVFLDSTDGVTWHLQSNMASRGQPTRIAAGPGGVVAVGSNGDHQLSWFSPDGLTWTSFRDAFRTPGGAVVDVVAEGDGWLAVGARNGPCSALCAPDRALVWSSHDGMHWTQVPDTKAFHSGFMNAVAHGADGFVAVGESLDSDGAAIWTSPGGRAWSRIPNEPVLEGLAGPGYHAGATDVAVHDGVIVVIGYSREENDSTLARAWRSSPGQPWSRADVDGVQDETSVTATPDGFLITGWSPSCPIGIWASLDGLGWRCDTADPGLEVSGPVAVAASGAVEVAVGFTNPGDDPAAPSARNTVWSRSRP